jgi:hypothetical protein
MGKVARAYRRTLRRETNLETAVAVVVLGPGGRYTLIGKVGQDQADISQTLIGIAFAVTEPSVAALERTPEGTRPTI